MGSALAPKSQSGAPVSLSRMLHLLQRFMRRVVYRFVRQYERRSDCGSGIV